MDQTRRAKADQDKSQPRDLELAAQMGQSLEGSVAEIAINALALSISYEGILSALTRHRLYLRPP